MFSTVQITIRDETHVLIMGALLSIQVHVAGGDGKEGRCRKEWDAGGKCGSEMCGGYSEDEGCWLRIGGRFRQGIGM